MTSHMRREIAEQPAAVAATLAAVAGPAAAGSGDEFAAGDAGTSCQGDAQVVTYG